MMILVYKTFNGWIISLLWIFFLSSNADTKRLSRSSLSSCPDACFCNTPSKIVYCSRRGLLRIPDKIPEDSLQINLNANSFQSHILRRSNLSRYSSLEHLYLSDCSLESIDVDAFMDLASIRWLDLSNNLLKVIHEFTFRGLLLHHLFLNGNRHVKFHQDSFNGLTVTGLYLHDCSLASLQPELLRPLNATLKNLWLSGNELEKIGEELLEVFTGLQHLRLGYNPLRCDCESAWLKTFYDSHPDLFKGAMAPSCLSPRRLKGKHFNEISSSIDLRCQVPMFTNIEAYIQRNEARLKCGAIGDPPPSLYWIQPSGKTSKFTPPGDGEVKSQDDTRTQRIEGILNFNWDTDLTTPPTGMFICIAKNQAGNVTLTINLPQITNQQTLPSQQDWNNITYTDSIREKLAETLPVPALSTLPLEPFTYSVESPSLNHIQSRLLRDSLSLKTIPSSDKSASNNKDLSLVKSRNYSYIEVDVKGDSGHIYRDIHDVNSLKNRPIPRLFTLTEFVTAVVLTHLLTLVFGIALIVVLNRTRYKLSLYFPCCSSCCYNTLSSYEKQQLQAARRAELRHQLQYASSSCGTSSYYGTHKSMHNSSNDDVTECVYLNGLHHHRLQSYTNSPGTLGR